MKGKLILLSIFILAFILRFFALGRVPTSLDWDEASLGYNAYSIIKTGRDEYGNFLPIQFRSFADFKPPFYVYSIIPFITLLDLTELATRLPSAIFGFATVILVYLLVRRIFPQLKYRYILLISFLLAISPWHIQFSRVAFESNVGLFWFVLGTLFFSYVSKNKNYLFLSAIAFVIAMYTYHSLRLVVPLFVVGLLLIHKEHIRNDKKTSVLSLLLTSILLLPLIFSLGSGASARFGSVTIVKPEELTFSIQQMEYDIATKDGIGKLLHNRRIIYSLGILKGYLDHWDLSFLFLQGDGPDRHHAPNMGMLYFIELPFVLLGLFSLIFSNQDRKGKQIIFFWFLVAPLASSLTTGTPHAVRALLFLPTYQIFTAFGIKSVIKNFHYASYVITFLFVLNMIYYLDMYYIHGPIEQAVSWQYGYKEMVSEVSKIKSNYENVVITYKYDQPYIYFLFYEKTDPSWYQNYWKDKDLEIQRFERKFGNYEFRNIDWEKDKNLINTLLVGTPAEIPQGAQGIIKEINFPDGSVAFRIVSLD